MAIDPTFIDHPELDSQAPADDRTSQIFDTQAGALDGRLSEAEQARHHAEQRDATLLTRHDPAERRTLRFALGAALVARGRGLLVTVVGAGYLALLGLRTRFLTTVTAVSLPVALLQSAMLTVISAGLVLSGSAVLARTQPPGLAHSRGAARRARQAVGEARAARNRAAEKRDRHLGGLGQMLLSWALGSAVPAWVDRANWAAARERGRPFALSRIVSLGRAPSMSG